MFTLTYSLSARNWHQYFIAANRRANRRSYWVSVAPYVLLTLVVLALGHVIASESVIYEAGDVAGFLTIGVILGVLANTLSMLRRPADAQGQWPKSRRADYHVCVG